MVTLNTVITYRGHHQFGKDSAKRAVCYTLIVLYVIYSTVGQSIASIYNLGTIYIGYGPPYTILYTSQATLHVHGK